MLRREGGNGAEMLGERIQRNAGRKYSGEWMIYYSVCDVCKEMLSIN